MEGRKEGRKEGLMCVCTSATKVGRNSRMKWNEMKRKGANKEGRMGAWMECHDMK